MKFLKGNKINQTKGGKPKMKRTIGLIALMAVLMMGITYGAGTATCVWGNDSTTATTPDTYLRGINVNIAVNLTDYVNANTTLLILTPSVGTLNGSAYVVINHTDNSSVFNFSIDTTGMKDDSVTTFTVTIFNGTTVHPITGTGCTRTFISDNTAPVCIHSQSSRETYNPKQTWTVTGTNSSSATIKFGANDIETMTEASDIFTWTGQLPESTYEPVRGITSDGLNSTSCDLNYVRIDAKSTIKQVGVAIAAQEGQKAGARSNTAIIVIIVALGIWYIKKKQ